MTIEIRRITDDELGAFLATMTTAFPERPDHRPGRRDGPRRRPAVVLDVLLIDVGSG